MPSRADPIIEEGHLRLKHCHHGWMLYNARDQFIGRSLDLYGEFSELECQVFAKLIRPGQTVYDVGANIGAHTLAFARLVGETENVFGNIVSVNMLCIPREVRIAVTGKEIASPADTWKSAEPQIG